MGDELETVRPTSIEELGHVVRRAAANGWGLYPFGGRTMFDYGLPPERPGIEVDLRGLDRVIDYPARDMTITVQAGVSIARLQEMLRAENQQLPIDVPTAERATLGGILATNVSGSRRYGRGTLRDYVLGISVVNDQGTETKAGGRVVKNVAGYDLPKLHIGALGTLGIITQATLKLVPIPDEQALLVTQCAGDDLERLLDVVHRSQARPVCIELLNRAAIDDLKLLTDPGPWAIAVGVTGNRDTVAWQARQLSEELAANNAGGIERQTPEVFTAWWHALVDFPLRSDVRLTFKANVLPSATGAFCRMADRQFERLLLQAHAGNGIVIGHVLGQLTLEQATKIISTLLESATAAQGNLVLLRCPPEWKRTLPVWGKPREDLWLMQRVKQQFDPHNIFNPGRFV